MEKSGIISRLDVSGVARGGWPGVAKYTLVGFSTSLKACAKFPYSVKPSVARKIMVKQGPSKNFRNY